MLYYAILTQCFFDHVRITERGHAMLYFVCYDKHAMLCYAMLWYAMQCYVMQCNTEQWSLGLGKIKTNV